MCSWSMLVIKILRGASSGPGRNITEGAGWKVVREVELWEATGVETNCGILKKIWEKSFMTLFSIKEQLLL